VLVAGQACLIVALCCALYGIGASLYGARAHRRDFVASGRRAVYAMAGATALAFVLLEVAKTVHGGEDYFTTVGAFPNLNTAEFPVSDESARYFKSGPPFLQRYLPFWLASFIERRLLILVPFLAVLVGLLQALPRMLEARVKQRLVVWYRELKSLEDEIWRTAQPTPELINQWREEIEEIDAYAGQIRMPQRYFQDVYALKQAIAVVRNRIVQIAAHTAHADVPD